MPIAFILINAELGKEDDLIADLRKMENMMGTAVLDYFSILGLVTVTEEMMKMNMDDLPYKGEMK